MTKKTVNEQISDVLRQMALGQVSDAVRLLMHGNELTERQLKRLNLVNVADIKRAAGGVTEIKFFDRLKAIQCLMAFEQQADNTGTAFIEALMKSASSEDDE